MMKRETTMRIETTTETMTETMMEITIKITIRTMMETKSITDVVTMAVITEESTRVTEGGNTTEEDTVGSTTAVMENTPTKNTMKTDRDMMSGLTMTTTTLVKSSCVLSLPVQY